MPAREFRCCYYAADYEGVLAFYSEGLGDVLGKIMYEPIPVPSQQGLQVPPGFDAWWQRASERSVGNLGVRYGRGASSRPGRSTVPVIPCSVIRPPVDCGPPDTALRLREERATGTLTGSEGIAVWCAEARDSPQARRRGPNRIHACHRGSARVERLHTGEPVLCVQHQTSSPSAGRSRPGRSANARH